MMRTSYILMMSSLY